jgi:hypothetical protein
MHYLYWDRGPGVVRTTWEPKSSWNAQNPPSDLGARIPCLSIKSQHLGLSISVQCMTWCWSWTLRYDSLGQLKMLAASSVASQKNSPHRHNRNSFAGINYWLSSFCSLDFIVDSVFQSNQNIGQSTANVRRRHWVTEQLFLCQLPWFVFTKCLLSLQLLLIWLLSCLVLLAHKHDWCCSPLCHYQSEAPSKRLLQHCCFNIELF